MSLKTWKEEFYPTEALSVQGKRGALEHSLRKWEGLLKKNIKKHDVILYSGILEDEDELLEINAESCALCCKYLNDDCEACPLFVELGSPCDRPGHTSPYGIFLDNDDAKPMIRLLRKALAQL